ncbi:MAG: type II secretion system protein GspF [Burkholderiales bacterium PBB3]|nr:MAG: type II secretion system protein GspF [Burkholderiales bacterium PBB3]
MLPRPKPAPSASAPKNEASKLTPSSMPAVQTPLNFSFSKSVGIKHVVAMSEQLLTLIEAGLPLDRALHISLGSLSHERFKRVMEMVVIEVEKGSTLADAFAKTPSVFPRLYINMIRAGEEGGVLPLVIRRLVEFYTRSIEFRSFLITSSIYPAVLFVFGVSALLGLTVFVLPKFGQIFADMNQTLPLPAAILISAGEFLQSNGLYILCGVALLVLVFLQALRNPYWLEIWQRILLRVPLVGNLILKIQLANVCRTWGTLMASGVPILTGMRIVRELSNNLPLAKALDRVVHAVQEGKGVATPILADPFFPRLLGQLATVGEESGALDKMLLKVADQYESDIQKATRNLVSIFEPIMILVMGGLIGTVVVSMLSAIFSINDMPL